MRNTDVEPCRLSEQTRQLILLDLVEQWASYTRFKPSAVWIREYASLTPDEMELGTEGLPCGVWFLDETGLHLRRIWDYTWFHVFQFVQPWCSLNYSCLDRTLWGQHRHEIGLARFAPLEGEETLYIEFIAGGTTGGGDLFRVSESGSLVFVKGVVRF